MPRLPPAAPWAALLALTLATSLGHAAEPDGACPPYVDEARRPSAPCVIDDRIYTPRLDWSWGHRKVPSTVEAEMKRVAALLAAHPEIAGLRIEGHEADQPGRDAYGRCVTCRRAEALRDLLVAEGVAPGRIETLGFGESRPLFDPRDAAQNGLNDRFEWHVVRRASPVDASALKALAHRWRACLGEGAGPLGIGLLLDVHGRLATVVLDRPGPLACMVGAVGSPLGTGPARVNWPAPDTPSPYPPPPIAAPTVAGQTCAERIGESRRPAQACVDPDGTRIWLPAVPRSPKSGQIPLRAYPIVDGLTALLKTAPQIARVRIEAHDYRDPHAGDRAVCHVCRRAAALRAYLVDHGIDADRIGIRGHDLSRPPHGRPAGGPPRYEVHIEGWMAAREGASASREQGEVGAHAGPRNAEAERLGPEGKSRPEPPTP